MLVCVTFTRTKWKRSFQQLSVKKRRHQRSSVNLKLYQEVQQTKKHTWMHLFFLQSYAFECIQFQIFHLWKPYTFKIRSHSHKKTFSLLPWTLLLDCCWMLTDLVQLLPYTSVNVINQDFTLWSPCLTIFFNCFLWYISTNHDGLERELHCE